MHAEDQREWQKAYPDENEKALALDGRPQMLNDLTKAALAGGLGRRGGRRARTQPFALVEPEADEL